MTIGIFDLLGCNCDNPRGCLIGSALKPHRPCVRDPENRCDHGQQGAKERFRGEEEREFGPLISGFELTTLQRFDKCKSVLFFFFMKCLDDDDGG